MCFLFYSQFLQLIIIWHGANMSLKMISGIFSKIIPHKINNNDFRKLFSFQLSTRFNDVSLVSFSLLVNNNTFIPNAFTFSQLLIISSINKSIFLLYMLLLYQACKLLYHRQYFHFEVLL